MQLEGYPDVRGFIPPCAIDEAKQHTSIDQTSVRSPSQKNYNLIVAEPDEGIDQIEDGCGGLEGGDVGQRVLWENQSCGALSEQQVPNYRSEKENFDSMFLRFAGENRYQNTIGAAFGAREVRSRTVWSFWKAKLI